MAAASARDQLLAAGHPPQADADALEIPAFLRRQALSRPAPADDGGPDPSLRFAPGHGGTVRRSEPPRYGRAGTNNPGTERADGAA